MAIKRKKNYEKLSLIYSYLMRNISYKLWAQYLATVLNGLVLSTGKVLELGAGNCSFANYFSNFYSHIFATDLSKNMLASDSKNIVPKIACDMTLLPFKTKFDLIYSTFDSVNYLMSKKKLFALFKQVKELLNEDGVFTFDASLEKNSIIHSKKPERRGKYKGVNFIQISHYNRNSRIHYNYFELRMKNGIIFSESHKQKIFPFNVYFELIEKAGMYVLKCYEAFSFKNGSPYSKRVQFIIKKRKKNVEV